MVDMYIPEQSFDRASHDSYYSNSKVGTLDVLGATLDDTLYYNPLAATNRFFDQYTGPGKAGKMLTPEEWADSEYYRDNITVDDTGITEGLAKLMADRSDKRAIINSTLSRSKGGFGLMAAQFGVGFAGSLLDPLNVATGFIPALGAARMATMTAKMTAKYGKAGGRLAAGAVNGVAGAAVLEPLIAGQAATEQYGFGMAASMDADYGLMDSFLNLTFGGVLGGGIHYGVGKLSDRIEASAAKDEALARSVAQAASGQPIQVGQLIAQTEAKSLDDTLQRANERIARERPDAAAVERTVDLDTGEILSEQVTARTETVPETPEVRRKGTALPKILKTQEPRSLLKFISDMGGIWTGEKMIEEVKRAAGGRYKGIANKSQASKTQVRGKKKITEKVRPGGKTLDDMLTMAREEGFLPPAIDGVPDEIDINDLLRLIELEARDGVKQYSDADIGQVQAFDDAAQLATAAERFGIDPKGMDDDAFLRAIQEASENQEYIDFNTSSVEGRTEDANTLPIYDGGELTEAEAMKLQQESQIHDYNLGEDAEAKPILDEMDEAGTTPPDIDPVIVTRENELLQNDVDQMTEAGVVIPQDFIDAIDDATDLVTKADTVYDDMTRAGVVCMNRNYKG